MINIHNSWMNDPVFLAQAAHSGWAFAITLLAAYLGGTIPCLIVAGGLILFAAVKEFWYDANYELPIQTATDNWTDFAGYMGGIVLGLIVVFLIKPHL